MTSPADVLNLPVPSGKTALLQHLQTLVLRGNPWWIGGVVAPQKLPGLAAKMAARYPILRGERGRTYDRSKGIAGAHFIAFRTPRGVAWWVLSSAGKGGLADRGGPDARVARHAMAANGHIVFEDYVLLYAHKKDARTICDAATGRERQIIKDCSTWTWKMTATAYNEVQASIEREVKALAYGQEEPVMNGLRGVLAFQRRRPLFSGVRTQVLQLHREADAQWGLVRKAWRARYTKFVTLYGDKAGALRPLREITAHHLPKMGRFKVFGSDTIADLVRDIPEQARGESLNVAQPFAPRLEVNEG
jgi:hypothetical protein